MNFKLSYLLTLVYNGKLVYTILLFNCIYLKLAFAESRTHLLRRSVTPILNILNTILVFNVFCLELIEFAVGLENY